MPVSKVNWMWLKMLNGLLAVAIVVGSVAWTLARLSARVDAVEIQVRNHYETILQNTADLRQDVRELRAMLTKRLNCPEPGGTRE